MGRSGSSSVDSTFGKPQAKLEKGIRGFRVTALTSVVEKWHVAVVVAMWHEEPEPIEWKELHVGAERCQV